MEAIVDWLEPLAGALNIKAWIVVVFVVILAALMLDFLRRIVMNRLHVAAERSENLWDDALVKAARGPLSLLIWVIGISIAAEVVPAELEDAILNPAFIQTCRQLAIIFGICWYLVTLVSCFEENAVRGAARRGREIDRATVFALGRVVRVAVVVTGSLVALETMGFSISGLMAAGGIGGLAIGFASKDLLANFFGGITVMVDRPFTLGDWIIIKSNGIEGVVEKIGWRQTVIRKFDKRPVYVPNSVFTTASVENPSRMTHRRIFEYFGIRKEDASLMSAITDDIREMLKQHEEIDDSQTLMVQFDVVSPTALEFFIYCMTHTVVWTRYHEVKQDVLLKVNDIIERHGASLAYPTQVLKHQSSPEFAGLGADKNE